MKIKSKNFMQIDFNSIKVLGIHSATLLAYYISQSNIQNSDTVICEYDNIRKDLGIKFTNHLIRESNKILVNKELISIIENYRARINGYKLIVENIDKLMVNEVNDKVNKINDKVNEVNDKVNEVNAFNTDIKNIDNRYTDTNSFHEQAHSSSQQAVQEVSYLDKLASEAWASTPDNSTIKVDFLDTQDNIKKKAKVARKAKQTKANDLDIQPKWLPFLEFIKNELSICYPVHRNKAGAIKASIEFAQDINNDKFNDQEILDIVEKIKKHYLVYCKEIEFPVGPARYINDMMWTTSLKGIEQEISNEDKYKFSGWE